MANSDAGELDDSGLEECGVCSQEIDEEHDTVSCEGICEKKIHITCAGMNAAEAQLVDNCINISYVCNKCFVLTPKGLNTRIKELANILKKNEEKVQKNAEEMFRKQDSLNSSIKLYMKDILADVKVNKNSLGKITTAMKTLFESCHEDKQTLCNITSYLKENGNNVTSVCDKIDKMEKQTSKDNFETQLREFNATLESMADVTSIIVENGLKRHQEIVSEINDKFKGKKTKIKFYKKIINSLKDNKTEPKYDEIKTNGSEKGKYGSKRKNNKSSRSKRVADVAPEQVEMQLSPEIVSLNKSVSEIIILENIEVYDHRIENMENSSTVDEYEPFPTPCGQIRSTLYLPEKKQVKFGVLEPKKEKQNKKKKKTSEKIKILSNIPVSKMDASINMQIVEYNKSVETSNKYFDHIRQELTNQSAKIVIGEKIDPIIIVRPKAKGQNSGKTQDDLKQAIDSSEIRVSGVKNIRQGGIMLRCETEIASVQDKLGDKYEVFKPNPVRPQLKMVGMTVRHDKQLLVNRIRMQNKVLENAEINILQIEENMKRKGEFYATMEIDSASFKRVIQLKRINVGWERCLIFENGNLVRCYKCCGYNHMSLRCLNKQACSKCAGEHMFKDCTVNDEKCVNCEKANERLRLGLDIYHPTWSRDCEVYKQKMMLQQRRMIYNK